MVFHYAIVVDVAMIGVLITEFLQRQAQMYLGAVAALNGGVFMLNEFQQLSAAHGFCGFSLIRFAEGAADNFSDVLLLHVIEVQLLNTGYLAVVEPVGCLQLANLVKHLCIELGVVNLTTVVNEQPPSADGCHR